MIIDLLYKHKERERTANFSPDYVPSSEEVEVVTPYDLPEQEFLNEIEAPSLNH